jgi:hypothetical protein
MDRREPIAMAAQHVKIPERLPGFEIENSIDLPGPSIPGLWVGNQSVVAAHFDLYENIACVVGGHRRFTLFPPDQVRNLYIGPIELTPAGVPISLVDLDAPDLTRFPRFEQALAAAEVAELEPGDAIYIPYLWWHHVRALDRFNVLVNYWWSDAKSQLASPLELLMMGLVAMRDLPPTYREAWRGLFDHWVFQTHGDPAEHMPRDRRGALGETTRDVRQFVRERCCAHWARRGLEPRLQIPSGGRGAGLRPVLCLKRNILTSTGRGRDVSIITCPKNPVWLIRPMSTALPATPVWRDVTPDLFRERIIPANRPAVLKGLVADWPAVQAARESPRALADYIGGFAAPTPTPTPTSVMIGSPAIKGRFFYAPDMSGMNFTTEKRPLRDLLGGLIREMDNPNPPALSAQGVEIRAALPGFEGQNRLDLLAPTVHPRIWIGNAVTVAAHFDLFENIACVVGGRRRFTLFPPDQVRNLYIGPMEKTPAGAPISMVDFDAPDLQRYPLFEQALEAAQVADLEPGDALYIPYLWWHHVRSLEPFNVLVNYWWSEAAADVVSPQQLMLMALISVRDLPPHYREAWRGIFDHWAFRANGDPTAHLPPEARGALGGQSPTFRQTAKAALLRSLGGG